MVKKKTNLSGKLWDLMSKYMRQKVGRCQWCGFTDGLQVHHIVPKGRGNGPKYDEKNLIVLCCGCHKYGWHGKWTTEECRDRAISIVGEDRYLELHRNKNYTRNISSSEYEEMIEVYKTKIKELK